jgi:hypothetical protein
VTLRMYTEKIFICYCQFQDTVGNVFHNLKWF